MNRTIQQAYDQYINLVWELLQANCPVDTGNMYTHIRMNNYGKECEIIIDTIPYTPARAKKSGLKNPKQQIEYAEYTEFRNKSKGWIRRDSILAAAHSISNNVICEIDIG